MNARGAAATGTATVPARTVAVFTEASSTEPPAPPTSEPTLTVSPEKVEQGGKLAVTGANWTPNSKVTLTLGDIDLGTFTTDAKGNLKAEVTVPKDTKVGSYTLTATGADDETASAKVQVVASTGGEGEGGEGEEGGSTPPGGTHPGGKPGGSLPVTGAHVVAYVLLGSVLLGGGYALWAASRKRHS